MQSKIQTSLDTAKALTDVLTENNNFKKVSESLHEASQILGPFLGGIGALANVIFEVLPTGPSIEERILEEMENGFNEANSKLDQLQDDIRGLNANFEWLLTAQTFTEYNLNIVSANDKLEILANISILISELEQIDTTTLAPTSAPGSTPVTGATAIPTTHTPLQSWKITYEEKIEEFLDFCRDDIEDHTKIGNALTPKSIFTTFNSAKSNDRRKLLNLGKTIMFYLAESSKIDLNCEGLKERYWRTMEEREKEWNKCFAVFERNFVEAENNVINVWNTQAKDIDIPRELRNNYHKGYSSLADHLEEFLVDKYYWRDWFIAVYDNLASQSVGW